MYYNLFFFFKQKTAYEMRISDWSSDVCSSDLVEQLPEPADVPDRAVVRHARLPSKISFAKWQRDRWPASTSMSSGRSRVQMSCANRHRGWKRHPLGGFTRSGGDPGIARSFFFGPFTLGNASRRPIA